jgi:hypothetical protein
VSPHYWVSEAHTLERLGTWRRRWLLTYRRVTNATNERTMVAAALPLTGVVDKLPLIFPGDAFATPHVCCLLGSLDSLCLDYAARQKVGGTQMDLHYVKQLPVLLLPAETALDFPGETFRVLKNKEEKAFGEYRTRRLVLEAWERPA